MHQPMLFIHWRQARLMLAPAVIASFGLPLLAVQGLGPSPQGSDAFASAYASVAAMSVWLPLFPILAISVGAGLALTSWNWDHQLHHVYALSLPLARWEYVLLKMAAGLLLALLPVMALWLGAHLASASVTLPVGLRAYPDQIALRFFLAVGLAYSLTFALAAGTTKTTSWVLTACVLLVLASVVVTRVAPSAFGVGDGSLLGWLVRVGGPFEVFTGNWALIDV